MNWTIEFFEDFLPEYESFSKPVKLELLANLKLLKKLGPQLGRPHVDTLNDSNYANMKELRFSADNGVWRFAFAFDPERKAILLVAGDKTGKSEKYFYKQLIRKADKRFKKHLLNIKQGDKV
ncbi:MAG: type II toxin-antitoxin system RelE/ParE family toxin [Vampirovibrionia bacterium]